MDTRGFEDDSERHSFCSDVLSVSENEESLQQLHGSAVFSSALNVGVEDWEGNSVYSKVDEHRYEQAAVLVENAWKGRESCLKLDTTSIRNFRIFHSKKLLWISRFFVLLNFSIILFEAPAATFHIPTWIPILLELLCLCYYVFSLWFKNSFQPQWIIFTKLINIFFAAAILLTLVDIVCHVAFGSRRSSLWLRPVFALFYSRPLRLALVTIRNMIFEVAQLIFVVLCLVAFHALFAYILFWKTEEGELYAPSLWLSFVNFYALMTTVNYPDIQMPTYSKHPIAGLFFVNFLVIVTFFLLNIFLAIVFLNYQNNMKRKVDSLRKLELRALATAFVLLDPHNSGRITETSWTKMLLQLNKSVARHAHMMYRILQNPESGYIGVKEFASTIDMLNIEIRSHSNAKHILKRLCPWAYRGAFGRIVLRIAQSRIFRYTMDAIILVNIAWLISQFARIFEERDSGTELSTSTSSGLHLQSWHVEVINVSFFFIFTLEAVIKVYAAGPGDYWREHLNKLDVLVLFANLCFILFAELIVDHGGTLGRDLLRMIFLLRCLRLLRFMAKLPRVHDVVFAINQILPMLATYVGLILIIYYEFIMFGMWMWEGQIYPENPKLEGTDFAKLNYFANNFNSFPEALMLCFELTVVNNWQYIADGFVALSGSAAYLFFILFHILTVLIMLNLIVAAVLESFQLFYSPKSRTELETRIRQYKCSSHVWWTAKFRRGMRRAIRRAYSNLTEREVEDMMIAAVEDERVRLGDGAGSTFVSVAAGITDSGDMAFDGSSGLSPGEVLPAVLRNIAKTLRDTFGGVAPTSARNTIGHSFGERESDAHDDAYLSAAASDL